MRQRNPAETGIDIGELTSEEIALIEQFADTRYDIAAVDAAAQVYGAAVKAAGGAYGHALAAVWRAWQRHGGDE